MTNMSKPSKFLVRPSLESDEQGIRKVQVTTWKHAYRGMIPDRILDEMTVTSPPRRPQPPDTPLLSSRRIFVAVENDSSVLGFAVGGMARDIEWNYESELWAIYVLPSEQGRGIGHQLFQTLATDLARDYKSMIIWVLEANHPSHKFYERMGGTRLELTKTFKWKDEPIATEVAYGWKEIRRINGRT